MNKQITSVLKITTLALVLSFGLSYALAWTTPTQNPPSGNVAAPINIGATAQTKNGDLTAIRLFSTASSSIGTMAQTQTLTIAGTVGATGDICTAEGGGKCLSTVSAGGIDPAPIGSIVSYAGATAPSGYLICDGTAVSRTTYAALFAAIGTTYGAGNGSTTFNLPDLRGEFIRGFSNGRAGVDVGRTFGSWQDDLFESHTHGVFMTEITASTGGTTRLGSGGNTNTLATGGTETRPRNIAMNYIIKAVNNSEMVLVQGGGVTGLTAGAGITLSPAGPDAKGLVTVSATAQGSGLGYGQTWQDVTASRVMGTTYTNSTGKPIQVIVTIAGDASGRCGGTFYVNNIAITGTALNGYCGQANGGKSINLSAVIPDGNSYKVAITTYGTKNSWFELR